MARAKVPSLALEPAQEQAALLTTISPPTANLARGEAARRIVDLARRYYEKDDASVLPRSIACSISR
mgnify:CR=1 FL=1